MRNVEKSDPSAPSLVKIKWIDGLRFVATDSTGHSIVMDASTESGGEGSGFSPMQLLLIALGGCTSMDVVHILQKQRQQVNGLEVSVTGHRVKDPPRIYHNIRVEYKIMGTNIKENAIQRAIQLSEDRYCSVGAMLKTKAKVVSDYVIQ
ncbi:MAG: OsmC family protein [Candidatus Bathyarchaeota archaeon]|nr:OsmC family protein [Candidatus Bathyarchaeota archaeon]MDH5732661.1 OsmC family protein [Candidatus Bathyarchaeota archaeon]